MNTRCCERRLFAVGYRCNRFGFDQEKLCGIVALFTAVVICLGIGLSPCAWGTTQLVPAVSQEWVPVSVTSSCAVSLSTTWATDTRFGTVTAQTSAGVCFCNDAVCTNETMRLTHIGSLANGCVWITESAGTAYSAALGAVGEGDNSCGSSCLQRNLFLGGLSVLWGSLLVMGLCIICNWVKEDFDRGAGDPCLGCCWTERSRPVAPTLLPCATLTESPTSTPCLPVVIHDDEAVRVQIPTASAATSAEAPQSTESQVDTDM